ncbi:uncharacterized protein [Amphiura filiformis]|uniref:uncharacterized protein isoform X2 n=1 Tax=Amphiura filiformis TaxID=82378 RepID=UPI003B213D21
MEGPLDHDSHQPNTSMMEVALLICSVLVPALLPYLHLGVIYQLWEDTIRIPDRHSCTCNCWDTAFKGPYEKGIASYKHVYFNVTSNTLKIWVLTVLSVITLYETVRRLLTLAVAGQLRYSMMCLLISVIYPHYYSWWSYFNYWNDDFYKQLNHLLIFATTEMFSTIVIVHLLDPRTSVSPRKLLVIISIALFHILASGMDQFVENILNMKGALHQTIRDIGFMLPDILHVVLPLYELRQYAIRQHLTFFNVVSRKDVFACFAAIILAVTICNYL